MWSAVPPLTGAVQEIQAVVMVSHKGPLLRGTSIDNGRTAQNEGRSDGPFLNQRIDIRSRQRRMRAVGGNEVDQRFRMFQVLREIDPARIGCQLAVAGHFVELRARPVQ